MLLRSRCVVLSFNDPATTEIYTYWTHSFPTRRSSDLPLDTEIGPQLVQRDLAADHADGAGEGAGLGDDAVGRRRDEVAAGGRQVAHGDDHRLAEIAGALHLADRKSTRLNSSH